MNAWRYCRTWQCACRVIDEQTIWGRHYYNVWLPDKNTVVKVDAGDLLPLHGDIDPQREAHRITYVTAGARVAEILEFAGQNRPDQVLLAPMESNVIPLPHQLSALQKAISKHRIRYLLADEVGLGKTVEAGLILRELKLRGLAQRILVITPKGLATQWQAEMQTHFNEHFQLVLSEDINTLQRLNPGIPEVRTFNSPWLLFDQVIVTLDSVKPIDGRKGWPAERVAEYNRQRFEDLINANWDLIIIDEAHRLGGGSEQVARYKLGRGLADAAPYLLLLTATPHQGKADSFHRLVSLLDHEAFPDMQSVTRERVAAWVIRTEKRRAVGADGRPLFKPRVTHLEPIAYQPRHELQRILYNAVTDYVRQGYNQAVREKKSYVGFLMILMQRLVVSSTRAIRNTLERRLAILDESGDDPGIVNPAVASGRFFLEEWQEMNGQELWEVLTQMRSSAVANEKLEVKTLLELAQRCEREGSDAKAEALIEWLYKLQSEENDADLKVLIFTEFVSTQEMLVDFLNARAISVVALNGSMDMEERIKVQEQFRGSVRVLVSTDAGGEGLNLQFCHIVINYDMPWNPMRLEQRIGRVDRIGQEKTVKAINFTLEESVEYRVREVLEEKLQIIFEEFGTDKTGDVLDSSQAGELFEDVFTASIINPGEIASYVDSTVDRIRHEFEQVREAASIFAAGEPLQPTLAETIRSHPLPHWVEQMTTGYILSHGGSAVKKRSWWEINWPELAVDNKKVVFSLQDASKISDPVLLNLENEKIRNLAVALPTMAAGQTIPIVKVNDLPGQISGFWGLFEVRLQAGHEHGQGRRHNETRGRFLRVPASRRGFFSIFVNHDGKVFLPTARHIWSSLHASQPEVTGALMAEEAAVAAENLINSASETGKGVFETLRQEHIKALKIEEDRGKTAFACRRQAIEKIGLPEVKHYRLKKCQADEAQWQTELQQAGDIFPDLRPLLLLKINNGGANE